VSPGATRYCFPPVCMTAYIAPPNPQHKPLLYGSPSAIVNAALGGVVGYFGGANVNYKSTVLHYPSSGSREDNVTTIVGMICKDGLVVASDSKATKGPTAREEFLKIWDLNVGNTFKAVITGAGRSAFIAKYRNLLEEVCAARAQRQPIQTVPEFITVAEETMQNMSRQYGTERLARLGVMRTGVGEEEHSSTSLFDILPNLVAVIGIHDDKPHLFFIPPDGIAEEQQLFGATGSGGPFADYLLPKMCRADFQIGEAALLAAHVIEQVKHVDPHSGGPTQLATVTKAAVRHWTKAEIMQAELRAGEIEAKIAAL